MNPRPTYRRGTVCVLAQTFMVVKDEGSVLIVVVGRTLWLILGVVVGEQSIRLRAGSRLEGASLGVERAEIHSG